VPEEDTHFPVLTLKETLTFAVRTKTPGVRLPEETRRNFRQEVIRTMLKMFGLVNQANTVCFPHAFPLLICSHDFFFCNIDCG
jgi:ATP-binding cassette, subfamily G (WHITE), member 2, SNQ2